MAPQLYWTLLFATLFYAFVRGGAEHRIAAAGCVLATFATRALRTSSETNLQYAHVELGVLIVDLALFGLFLFIALRSNRFWPLWISGFHLVSLTAHLIKAMKIDLFPTAYLLAVQVWSYPVLVCIGIGIWRAHQRRRAGIDDGPTFLSSHRPPPAST